MAKNIETNKFDFHEIFTKDPNSEKCRKYKRIFSTTYSFQDHSNKHENNKENYRKLIDEIKKYLRDNSNRQNNECIVVEEIVQRGTDYIKVLTLMRTFDLYVDEVVVVDERNRVLRRDIYKDGDTTTYNNKLIKIVPIFFYDKESCTARGVLINSQAFALSEAIRFVANNIQSNQNSSPFKFARDNRFVDNYASFECFSNLYNYWASLSENNDPRVDIKHLKKK